jgi:opacity protein-like surface antigen
MRSMILAALAVAWCSVAGAQNPARGWYLGLDAGTSQLDGELEDRVNEVAIPFNEDSNTFAVHAGYRFNRFLQLGLFYANLGSYSESDSGYSLDADLRGIGLQFTGRIPVGEKFGLLAHATLMNRRLDVSARAPGEETMSEYHGGLVNRWGLGMNYQFNHQWDLRLEHSHSSDVGETWYLSLLGAELDLRANLRTTTLGFRYKFPR